MTRTEAQKEAQKRWSIRGSRTGCVRLQMEGSSGLFEVGHRIGPPKLQEGQSDPTFSVKGAGNSWDAAFANADRRNAEFAAEYERNKQAKLHLAEVIGEAIQHRLEGSLVRIRQWELPSRPFDGTFETYLNLPDDPYVKSSTYRGEDEHGSRAFIYLTPAFREMVEEVASQHGVTASFNNDGSSFWFSKK